MAPPTGKEGDTGTGMAPASSKRGRPAGTKKTQEERENASKKRAARKKETQGMKQGLAAFVTRQDEETKGETATATANEDADAVLPPRVELEPQPIHLNGDDDGSDSDAGEDDDDDGEDIFDDLEPNGTVQNYLQHVFERLKEETKQNTLVIVDRWLMKLLCENDWLIPSARAEFVCSKLGIEYDEPAYYRDVYVWLPDIRFKEDPRCPQCERPACVHGWQTQHFGRIIITLYGHYYIISRRYKCNHCEAQAMQLREIAARAAAAHGGTTEDVHRTNESHPYTFMGYNTRSRELLPDGLGERFPAFLTHRGGVDMSVLDLMRPLFATGVRPDQIAQLLLELATKKYHREYLQREHKIARERRGLNQTYKLGVLFSEFSDKTKYCGLCPSAKFVSHVYKLFSESIRPHLDREVKKRGADYLRWDVSFKEAKKLCRYRGKPIFKGLVTATNEIGEIRIQFHIVTDGHDQMLNALREFRNTISQHGQPSPTFVFSDKPSDDFPFFCKELPRILEKQHELDDALKNTPIVISEQVADCVVEQSKITTVCGIREVELQVAALRDHLSQLPVKSRVLSLDTEYEYGSKTQFPPHGRDKVALIQIGFCLNPGGEARALLIQCRRLQELPISLLALFRDSTVTFVGVRVKVDIDHIAADFRCPDLAVRMKYTELAAMAKDRGVVNDARTGLAKLVLILLHENMDKDNTVRSSKWAHRVLTDRQKKYAALDAIKSMEVYLKLLPLPDYTQRLKSCEAKAGITIDIVAPRGKVGSDGMGTIAAFATVLEGVCWDPARREDISIRRTSQSSRRRGETRVVEVSKLFAPQLVAPGYKVTESTGQQRKATLGDFKAESMPFRVELPLTMLKRHDPSTDNLQETAEIVDPEGTDLSESRWCRSESTEEKEEDEIAGLEGRDSLTVAEMAEIQYLLTVATECRGMGTSQHKLDKPPDSIVDRFRSVLGDPFHIMDRPKVPIKHECKKAYFVAFMEAVFAWDPQILEDAKNALKTSGMSDEEIEAKMYYNVSFFLECVPRVVLPPRFLYWRVRNVFATFGPKVDSSGKPLFNDAAWKKANNILKEIIAGFYSDPPGISFYVQKMDEKGEPQTNRYGMPVLFCMRGTNLTESAHKQMLMSIGQWCSGIEMSDATRAEYRHRYNHRMSERRRMGFPRIGHYDTWLFDAIQILVDHNHNVLLFPFWCNSHDRLDTAESFGTVPLQSDELTMKVNHLSISPKLTREQHYLAKKQNVKIPFTPFSHPDERKLLARLILECPSADDEQMALGWVQHVNGTTILPKLAVYIRNEREHFARNQCIKDMMKETEAETAKLKDVNIQLQPQLDSSEHNHVDLSEPGDEMPMLQPLSWPAPELPRPLLPTVAARGYAHAQGFVMIGGVQIGIRDELPPNTMQTLRRRGERSTDRKVRRNRQCMRCNRYNGSLAESCRGRTPYYGEKGCQYFDAEGNARDY